MYSSGHHGTFNPAVITSKEDIQMLRNWSEKLKAKFPATTRSNSMAKNARLDDAFSEVFKREASQVEGQSLQQKDNKRRKRKGQKKVKKKNEKPKDVGQFLSIFDFCACQRRNVVKRDARHAVML